MTTARIQPFRQKHNYNLGCYDGFRVNLEKVQEEI